ncbi:MAG TPA: hypothetical protein PLM98_09530 [Thiolinea sp.]|nr:hypothetical protein [Thiolinea sp.]
MLKNILIAFSIALFSNSTSANEILDALAKNMSADDSALTQGEMEEMHKQFDDLSISEKNYVMRKNRKDYLEANKLTMLKEEIKLNQAIDLASDLAERDGLFLASAPDYLLKHYVDLATSQLEDEALRKNLNSLH